MTGFNNFEQHDAQEFINVVFEKLYEVSSASSSMLELPYRGFLRSMLCCENEDCRYESPNTNVFTTLPLPLCSGHHCTLMECLTLFCEVEALSEAEVALCGRCKCKTATKKKLKVTVWPNLLVVQKNFRRKYA